ncbi:MAG: glycosyltransferase family 8 protein [Candidatus Amulumruptor caecigallinarius]|nr:glycosyltransferase family 8 protein [Candidatus Amulumruptor caecigallinarius]MCM1395869.1 glycosyltransferase family 8 protein [Candidatus Amulumruptor caecigallinarius]MCM1454808.1 glycosyltransferase family 8 protein [bacterium]
MPEKGPFLHPSPIHILCSTDDRFAPWCGVMLTSLLHNLDRHAAVVHIVDAGISGTKHRQLLSLEHSYPARLHFITPTPSLLARLPQSVNGWPPASFLRLIATEILPSDLHRVIYLDCDIAVDTSIAPLWHLDLGGKACAVIPDAPPHIGQQPRSAFCDIKGSYFNSGVMVIDLDKFRHLDIAARSLAMLSALPPEFCFPDQDILNILLDGNHVDLPARWNVQSGHFKRERTDISGQELEEVRGVTRGKISGIIHYTEFHKPWCNGINDFHPLEHIWRRYLKLSPWATHGLAPRTLPLRTRLARFRHALAFRLGLPSAYLSVWKHI